MRAENEHLIEYQSSVTSISISNTHAYRGKKPNFLPYEMSCNYACFMSEQLSKNLLR